LYDLSRQCSGGRNDVGDGYGAGPKNTSSIPARKNWLRLSSIAAPCRTERGVLRNVAMATYTPYRRRE
jgi:hypothetical protein